MRWYIAIAAAALLVPAAQAQDAAQKLFEQMEQKVTKAKAYKFDFDLDATQGNSPIKVKGTLVVAAGNKLSFRIEGTQNGRAIKGTAVSDGKSMAFRKESEGKGEGKGKSTPEKLSETLTGWVLRAGLFVGAEQIDRSSPKDPAMLKLSDFKSAGKEKVEGREANVIEYTVARPDGSDRVTCKLWLDVKTNLPLKRTLEAVGKVLVTETYAHWELDPKLAEDAFTLPK
jgi:outer membrane lipoprotein-sorting protein